MGKIVYLMGKSASGKDTLYKKLLEDKDSRLRIIVPYTTRPAREGEENGTEYYFTDEAGYQELKRRGKLIEERAYRTCHGIWRYFTADDGQIDIKTNNYLMIGTLESYNKIKAFYGEDAMVPVLIEVEDGVRLQRALDRERLQEEPKYEEMCRRFLADAADFSEENIARSGIGKRFSNISLETCCARVGEYIREQLKEDSSKEA